MHDVTMRFSIVFLMLLCEICMGVTGKTLPVSSLFRHATSPKSAVTTTQSLPTTTASLVTNAAISRRTCNISNLKASPKSTSSVKLEWSSNPSNCSSNYSVVVGDGCAGCEWSVDANDLEMEVTDLPYPGYDYEIRMVSNDDGFNASISTHTVPDEPFDLTVKNRSVDAICLSWQQNNSNSNYSFQAILDGADYLNFEPVDETSASGWISCLGNISDPGKLHHVSVKAVFRNTPSAWSNLSVLTVPLRPVDLTLTSPPNGSLCLSRPEEGIWEEIDVTCRSIEPPAVDGTSGDWSSNAKLGKDWHFYCFKNLPIAGGTYRLFARAVAKHGNESIMSDPVQLTNRTAPAQPEAIQVSKVTNSSFEITWNQKGLFDNFTIEHLNINNNINNNDNINNINDNINNNINNKNTSLLTFNCDNSSKCSAVVGDLPIPGQKYDISLTAFVNLNDNKRLFGLPRNFSAVTAPATPDNFKSINRSMDSFCFQWQQRGIAKNFTVEIEGENKIPVTESVNDSTVQFCATNLDKSGTKYEVKVFAGVENVSSEPGIFHDWTVPAKPGPMDKIENRTTNTICFVWQQQENFKDFTCSYNNNNNTTSRNCPSFAYEIRDDRVHGCVGNLEMPGDQYNVDISSVVFGDANESIASFPATFAGRTLPPRLEKPGLVNVTSRSLGLRVTCPDEKNIFVSDGIIVEYNSTFLKESKLLNKTVTSSSQVCGMPVTLDGLVSGVKYQVGIRLTAGSLEGERSQVADLTTNLSPVSNLNKTPTAKGFSISWNPPGATGYYDYVTVVSCVYPLNQNVCSARNVSGPDNRTTLDDLIPGALYEVELIAHLNMSTATSNVMHHLLTAPKQPRKEFSTTTTSSLKVRMKMDEGYRCTHLKFVLNSTDSSATVVSPCSDPEATFVGLSDDRVYRVSVRAISDHTDVENALYSQSEPMEERMFTLPSAVRGLNYSVTGSNELTLRWSPPLNHKNIGSYEVQLKGETNEVKCNEDNLDCSKEELKYVFSDLEVDREYNISVAPVNPAGNGRAEFLKAIIPRASFPSWGVAPIVVSIVLLASLIGLLVWKRNRIVKPTRRAQPMGHLMTITEMNRQAPLPIKIDEFPTEVDLKHKDSEYLFSREFEYLTEISPKHPVTVAEKPDNRVKNRFVDILAFDHSRVKLSTGEMTETGDINDYINANFIPGFFSKREYIACQGPMRSTIDHFWQMIWDQKVSVVVMLTKLFEKGKEKCSQYWPDAEESQTYGEIQVRALTISSLNYYELRTFQVTFGSETRQLHHFWFLNWPDFGVPVDEELLGCIKDVRQMTRPQSSAPQVVHCSAGVGRTGTYILLDRALHVLERDSFVDIFGMVKEMREFRCRMVQTEPQYIFVHDCIKSEVLKNKTREQEVVYINQSFMPEPLYVNSTFASSKA